MAPVFLEKLFTMTHSANNFVLWDECGTRFRVTDVQTFARDVLPQYWKTNSYASFVRQLNLYGFRRTTDNNGKGVLGKVAKEWFHHPQFVRGDSARMATIERKPSAKRTKRDSKCKTASGKRRREDEDGGESCDNNSSHNNSGRREDTMDGSNSNNHHRLQLLEQRFQAVSVERDLLTSQNSQLASELAATQDMLNRLLARTGLSLDDLTSSVSVPRTLQHGQQQQQPFCVPSLQLDPAQLSLCSDDRDHDMDMDMDSDNGSAGSPTHSSPCSPVGSDHGSATSDDPHHHHRCLSPDAALLPAPSLSLSDPTLTSLFETTKMDHMLYNGSTDLFI